MPPITLDPDDSGDVAAVAALFYPTTGSATPAPADSCTLRYFVAYTQRLVKPLNNLILCEDLGDRLGPPIGEFPGPKEGAVSLVVGIGYIDVYYTGRDVGNDAGPFKLLKQRVVVPDIWPVDLTAVMRLRNVCTILARHFPDLAKELAPYLK